MAQLPTLSGNQLQNVQAGGHASGGDLTVVEQGGIGVVQLQSPSVITNFARLIHALKGGEHGPIMDEFCPALQEYIEAAKGEEVIGLDGKLEKASRMDQIKAAKRLKEKTYAELLANKFSHTYQRISLNLFEELEDRFESYIRPAILDNYSRQAIDALVFEQVVTPVWNRINDCGVDTELGLQQIRGMLWFLTGNCHIAWH